VPVPVGGGREEEQQEPGTEGGEHHPVGQQPVLKIDDHEQHTHDVPQTAYSSGNSRSSSTRSLVTRMPRGESL